MRVQDIPFGSHWQVRIEPDVGDRFPDEKAAARECRISWSEGLGLPILDHDLPVRIHPDEDRERWEARIRDDRPTIWFIEPTDAQNPSTPPWRLTASEFNEVLSLNQPVVIGIEPGIVESAERLLREKISPSRLAAVLEAELLLPETDAPGISRCFVELFGSQRANLAKGFRLHGPEYALDIREEPGRPGLCIATKLTRPRRKNKHNATHWLLRGRIAFADRATAEIAGRDGMKALLRKMEYLSIWSEYNLAEYQQVVDGARAFGVLRYSSCEERPHPDGRSFRFWLEKTNGAARVLERLHHRSRSGVELEAGSRLPDELRSDAQPDGWRENAAVSGRRWIGECKRTGPQPDYVDLVTQRGKDGLIPPGSGYLYVPLVGDRVRADRRTAAQNRIVARAAGITSLPDLLELSTPAYGRKRPTIGIPWARIEKKLGLGRSLTATQRLAVQMAVETPDLALIQGPPGTGKTTVIRAVHLALEDQYRKHPGLVERTLFASEQHDAVEHLAAASRSRGMPVLKVGRRRGQEQVMGQVEPWCRSQAEAVRAILDELGDTEILAITREISAMALGYRIAPTPDDDAPSVLRKALDLTRGLVSRELLARGCDLRDEIGLGKQRTLDRGGFEREDALRCVRGLRTTPVGFSDDGSDRAWDALDALQHLELLNGDDEALLERASEARETPDAATFEKLKTLKIRWIERLQLDLRPIGSSTLRPKVARFLDDLAEDVLSVARASASQVVRALDEYREVLEQDHLAVKHALLKYGDALATTCQQAQWTYERRVLLTDDRPEVTYDNVIIDEAARANPLDLLIPLSLARKRVVLVGDHRQLPQILDQALLDQIAVSKSDLEAQSGVLRIMEESLFERLTTHLRRLNEDGQARRTITLDEQFRMHPELGEFISRSFYEEEGEEFSSPRPASEFDHGLDRYLGKCAVWIDVPWNSGAEERGRSKSRPVEAKAVADEALRILSESRELSVGIITFYRDQVDRIEQLLLDGGVLTEAEDRSLCPAPAFAGHHSGSGPRIQVGTVDSFQGKEFDVVILSPVRSNTDRASAPRQWRTKYGFLTLANRLNVALSRQKKLLIVVGDAEMFLCQGAENAVPALNRFLRTFAPGQASSSGEDSDE